MSENTNQKDLYEIGTVSTILQLIKLPDGTYKVLVEGIKRAKLQNLIAGKDILEAEVDILEDTEMEDDLKKSYVNTLQSQFRELSKTSQKIRPEIANQVRSVERLEKLIDTLVGHLSISIADRQILLEELDLEERAKKLVNLLETQLDLTQMEKKIRNRVKKQMEKSQKEYYLSEQMKALKKEMGEGDDLDDEVGVVTRHEAVHLGIATQTDRGLYVPVVKHVEAMDIWSAAAEMGRVTQATRDGKAAADDLSGSTFTITSLGRMGGLGATPIINKPEVGILGVHNAKDRAVVIDGRVEVRRIMNLSSSWDHRVVDGHDGASLVQLLKSMLEHPATIFM